VISKEARLLPLWLLALVGAAASGCDQDCPNPSVDCGVGDGDADGDIESDGDTPRVCVIPEVECADDEHAEYGLCVDDGEELTVPATTFEMGNSVNAHNVTLSEFAIDRFEVTNERFRACVESGCCRPPHYDGSYSGRQPYYGNGDFDDFPVVFVTWDQAQEYCEGLGKQLPTEAQWELAARGDDGRLYPWGNDAPRDDHANFADVRKGDTEEVGEFEDGASPYGLDDMAGNVWEWVADWYQDDYYDDSPDEDPQGPEDGFTRVARGGSFLSSATDVSTFNRHHFVPTDAYSNVGFRCVRTGRND
jgi:formylglycine-generating enzyme required for sulfatase activity